MQLSTMRPPLVNSIERECAYCDEIGGSAIVCETDRSNLGATQAKNQQMAWQHGWSLRSNVGRKRSLAIGQFQFSA